MKAIILFLALAVSTSAFAMDPASQFVTQTMAHAKKILSLKSSSSKASGLCSMIKSSVGTSSIARAWLKDYADLPTDHSGVRRFYQMIPSLIVSRAMQGIGGGSTSGWSFDVGMNSEQRSPGIYAVAVTIHTSNGNPYNGKMIVARTKSGRFMMIDGEYLGFSAVGYLGRDFQRRLDKVSESNPDKPISALISQIVKEDGYMACR